MQYVDILGYSAGVITMLSLIPQTIKSWATKSTGDLSLIRYITYTTGLGLWVVYGVLITNYPLIITTGISTALALSILVMKLKYK